MQRSEREFQQHTHRTLASCRIEKREVGLRTYWASFQSGEEENELETTGVACGG